MTIPWVLNGKLLVGLRQAQDDCRAGSCYPAVGDLLLGRSKQLVASSTCGVNSPQKYCIIGYLEAEQKCFVCDSRYPYNPYTQHNSHMIENVITTFEPDRKKKWWQSENGVDHVSIRLDLETLFQFSHLILTFKTFRPAAMLVERSIDFGQTWKAFRYFAQDCAASFPNISSGPSKGVGDVICDSRYSDIEPSTEGEVLPRVAWAPDFFSFFPELITMTNLRINFTKLHTLGDALLGRRHGDPLEKYYYAVYEMVVRGNCFCNGHASHCDPIQNLRGDVFHQPGMVHGRCICRHNTEGLSCERCKDFYNDAPWRPAEGAQNNACKRCNCNGHSGRCHFDMAVYQASGGVSGGVCEDCQHNTTGQHCDQCKLFFYQDPHKAISDPHASCSCDPEGTLHHGACESRTDPVLGTVAGRCPCKENTEGVRCDKCKANHFGLRGSNPQGCQPCNCDAAGTLPFSICDPATGECLCQRFTTGQRCEKCVEGYWGLGKSVYGCSPCDCDIGGSQDNLCSPEDGQCKCLPNIVGRQCNEPAPGYFFLPLDYYIYEAEHQGQDPALEVVFRQPSAGRAVTWTGPGFARVPSGAGLRFAIDNIPLAMDFTIAIRYEPEVLSRWEGWESSQHPTNCLVLLWGEPICAGCDSAVSLLTRIALLQTPVCLEPGTQYSVDVYFSQPSASDPKAKPFILIDSVSNAVSTPKRLHLYLLIYSLYFEMFFVWLLFVSCKCNPQGSLNASCSKLGGQCHCKANVVGRCCDTCSAGSYGFGFHGCYPCECHPQGSVSSLCDQVTGQCACRRDVDGRRCSQCLPGYFGFPHCRPCPCHGFAELCHPVTGECLNCSRFTAGRHCERCINGYYGNPSNREPCRPCMCPGVPTSKRFFAHSCYQDSQTSQIVCNCLEGYSGSRCDECPSGFYKIPGSPGEECAPCPCNNNIDVTDPESCNRVTGECVKCLHNTHGANCQFCKPGYFGSALDQDCRICKCNPAGVLPATCPGEDAACLCDPATGACPCQPNVVGTTCDQCAPGYWDLAGGKGCQLCDCDTKNTQSNQCDQLTGQCLCKVGYGGKRCDECEENYFGNPQKHCISCNCNPEGTSWPRCDKATGVCNCRVGVTGRFCDQCGRGFEKDFPSCHQCHLCFDEWDTEITALAQTVQGLMRFAASLEDKGGRMPSCDMRFKAFEDAISEIERILKHPVFSWEALSSIKDFHGYVQQQIAQMGLIRSMPYEFPDFTENIEDIGEEADRVYELLQQKLDLHRTFHYLSLKGKAASTKIDEQMP
uniref:Laminin subunit beta-1 n=1 Tax=Phasianus colchicus TaxID=9054 RepID=A0A669P238_PHACC